MRSVSSTCLASARAYAAICCFLHFLHRSLYPISPRISSGINTWRGDFHIPTSLLAPRLSPLNYPIAAIFQSPSHLPLPPPRLSPASLPSIAEITSIAQASFHLPQQPSSFQLPKSPELTSGLFLKTPSQCSISLRPLLLACRILLYAQ